MNVPQSASRATGAWGEVERQFKLRAYLTQDIIAAVQTISPGQSQLVQALEDARQDVLAREDDEKTPLSPDRFRDFMTTQDALSVELGKVLDLMQLYPDQRKNPAVNTALARLEQSESRIVVARSDYIQAAKGYNRLVKTIPTRWVVEWVNPSVTPMIVSFDLPAVTNG